MKTAFALIAFFLLLPLLVTGIDFVEVRMGAGLILAALGAALSAFLMLAGRVEARRPSLAIWALLGVAAYFYWRGEVELAREDGVPAYVTADRILIAMSILLSLVVASLSSLSAKVRYGILIALGLFGLVN
ncbi:MAG: hypothetical protein ACQKBY_10330, partial [Verrucomicrobiales bacterium]